MTKPLIALVLALFSVLLFVVSMVRGLDLLNHYRRYRRYLMDYPSTQTMKGKVWKTTR